MARRITHLLHLSGTLVAEEPLAIGGLDAVATTDMPVARDGQGRPYLPGTSLAGALFAVLGLPESHPLRGEVGAQGPEAASRLWIDDAPCEAASVERWDGVGIDRITGAAALRVKFDREVLAAGSRFRFDLTAEAVDDLDEVRGWVQRARQLLQAGLALGAGLTRGLGRVRLAETRCVEVDWRNPDEALAWLADPQSLPDAGVRWAAAPQPAVAAPEALDITIFWKPRLPVMTKAAEEGLACDMLPFVSRLADGSYALTLPGAGLKGALREQAERIVRTVLGREVHADAPLHEAVDVPVVRELFGLARGRTQSMDEDSGPGRGRLSVQTVYAEQGRPRQAWLDLAHAESPPQGIERAMHVAIDRWTGGAATAFLYSAAEPMPEANPWRPMRLSYRARAGDEAALHLALLWLVLEDLRAGRIGLGFGKNRGYGEIAIERIEFAGTLREALGLPEQCEGNQSLLTSPPTRLKAAWEAWLAQEEACA